MAPLYRWRERGEDRLRIGPVDGQLSELLQHAAGDSRLAEDLVVDQVLAGTNAANDGDQVARVDVLQDERSSPGLDRREQLVLVVGRSQHDDTCVRQLTFDALGRLDAIGRR